MPILQTQGTEKGEGMRRTAIDILRLFEHARVFMACAMLLLSLPVHAADPDWTLFKQRFIAPEGRVIDNGQGNISHSEGQGFAMLLAVHHDDQPAFDLLWQWTRAQLQVRNDRLLAWKWAGGSVADRNNATDADLLVAWSLLRAAEKWQDLRYAEASAEMAKDIRTLLLRRTPHGPVLLPGLQGFDRPEGMVVNLSYFIFPALRDMARADPAPEWDELVQNGLSLLQHARFGRWGLPPDWLKLSEKLAPADAFPARFGYDAVRIPLYLLWGGQESEALLSPYRAFWAYFTGTAFLPAWASLKDDSVDSYDAPSGIHAIAQWTLRSASATQDTPLRLRELDERQPYYSSVLLLLCKMAARERGMR